jgi:hypothetical protein
MTDIRVQLQKICVSSCPMRIAECCMTELQAISFTVRPGKCISRMNITSKIRLDSSRGYSLRKRKKSARVTFSSVYVKSSC